MSLLPIGFLLIYSTFLLYFFLKVRFAWTFSSAAGSDTSRAKFKKLSILNIVVARLFENYYHRAFISCRKKIDLLLKYGVLEYWDMKNHDPMTPVP